MRAFIALELPEKIIKDLKQIQKELQKSKLEAKWTEPQNSHLTLVFLGWIEEGKIPIIKEVINFSAKSAPFNLQFNQLSCFPHSKRARVLYWGLEKNSQLDLLVHLLRKRLQQNRIWFDQKPFQAHLALARFRSPRNLAELLGSISLNKAEFRVEKITLFQSILNRSGPNYQILHQVPLKS